MMNPTGPSPISAGIAGAPLDNTAINSRKNPRKHAAASKNETAIRDTVETSDREADGKVPVPPETLDPQEPPSVNLDLQG